MPVVGHDQWCPHAVRILISSPDLARDKGATAGKIPALLVKTVLMSTTDFRGSVGTALMRFVLEQWGLVGEHLARTCPA